MYIELTDTTDDSHDLSELASMERGRRKCVFPGPTKINEDTRKFFFQKEVKSPEGEPDLRGVLHWLPKWDCIVRVLCCVKRWVNRGRDFALDRERDDPKPIQQHGYNLRQKIMQELRGKGDDQAKKVKREELFHHHPLWKLQKLNSSSSEWLSLRVFTKK